MSDMQESTDTSPQQAQEVQFNIWYLFLALPLVLSIIALFSFNADDISILEGGFSNCTYTYNRLGPTGAKFAWILLRLFGLAAYPFWLLCSICFIRRIIFPYGLRKAGWEYCLAIPFFGLSLAFLLGLWPELFSRLTHHLNIYQLPGGILGMLFSAPPSGLCYRLINGTGVFLVSAVLFVIASYTIIKSDWEKSLPYLKAGCNMLFLKLRNFFNRYPREEEQEQAAGNPAFVQDFPPINATPPASGSYSGAMTQETVQYDFTGNAQTLPKQMQPPQPSSPAASDVPPASYQDASPDPIAGFRTRRGDASIAAARAAQAAFSIQTPMASQRPSSEKPAAAAPQNGGIPIQENSRMTQPQPPAEQPVPRTSARAAIQSSGRPAESHAIPGKYRLPQPGELYNPKTNNNLSASADELENNRRIIQETLDEFNIDAEVRHAILGPQITLFEIALGNGVLVHRIAAIQSNLTMKLKAKSPVRMLLPIPGKDCSGVEVPNKVRLTVTAHELFASQEWNGNKKLIPVILGKNITGETIVIDLAKAPHLIVAGSTGSGKSVCVNLMIQSMLLHFRPDELKLIMFDPKFLEFQPYAKLPHLLAPIINDPAKVGVVLRWACEEMDHRYQLISAAHVKQLSEFNARKPSPDEVDEDGNPLPERLPFIVIIIDELADIMAQNGKEVELSLSRLAAKSRAAGIHLIVATQRPDSKVITGTIKNNFPWRVALKVTGAINSRVVIDTNGAESLLGYGDMLFLGTTTDPERIQGGWVTNEEIAAVVERCCEQQEQRFEPGIITALEAHDNEAALGSGGGSSRGGDSGNDDGGEGNLVDQALNIIKMTKRPTISVLQRHLRIGYNKAATLVDQLEEDGYIGPAKTSGLRDIYWDKFPGYGSDDE